MSELTNQQLRRELHEVRNRLYSLNLSLRAAKNQLERGDSTQALEAINAAILRAEDFNNE